MEITGRLTSDAQVSKVNEDRQVVNFSIAINDSYKPKGSSEVTEITTYVNCSYWLNTKAAEWLKKGALVQLFGRIGMNVYNNMEGKAIGALTFHVNNIKVLAFPKSREDINGSATAFTGQAEANGISAKDDLPF